MTFRLLLPLALLGLAACMTAPAEAPAMAAGEASPLDRLPPEIAGFTAIDPALTPAPPAGMRLRPYQAADGPVIRVTLQTAAPAERAGLAAGAEAQPLRDRLDAEAAASFAFASGLPRTTAERGPDFLVGRPGAGPLLRCIDIRLARPQGDSVALLRNLTCAGSLEGQVVRMQMIIRQEGEATAEAARVLAEFGGRAMESLLGLAPEPAAPRPAPQHGAPQHGAPWNGAPQHGPPQHEAPRRANGLLRV